jgi:hypothetical protein
MRQPRFRVGMSPAQLDRTLGRYWSRLTESNGDGTFRVTYRYNPSALRSMFPDDPKNLRLTVIYRDNKAQSLELWGTLKWSRPQQDRLAAYFLGDLDRKHPKFGKSIGEPDPNITLQSRSICYGEGIALAYEYAGLDDWAHYASIYAIDLCKAK